MESSYKLSLFQLKCMQTVSVLCGCRLLRAIRHAVSRHVFSESPSSSSEDSDQESQLLTALQFHLWILV